MTTKRNVVLFDGNLTRDPLVKHLDNGSVVTSFGVANNRTYMTRDGEKREETTFVEMYLWGKRGESFARYHKKGDACSLDGRLKFETWDTKDGDKRSKLLVEVTDWYFANSHNIRRDEGEDTPY